MQLLVRCQTEVERRGRQRKDAENGEYGICKSQACVASLASVSCRFYGWPLSPPNRRPIPSRFRSRPFLRPLRVAEGLNLDQIAIRITNKKLVDIVGGIQGRRLFNRDGMPL